MSFVDIAGIVRGASEGQGLGNKFLANIREADAICQVIRAFDRPRRRARRRPGEPGRDDIETINTELILADLQTIEKAIPRLEKEARLKKPTAAAWWPASCQRLRDSAARPSSPPASTSSRCASCSC